MSGTFQFGQFNRSCFHPIVNLAMFTWLAIGHCEVASCKASDPSPIFAQFQELLDSNQLDGAQKLLDSNQSAAPQFWVAESALRLAHSLYQIGCLEPARLLLDRYWPQIKSSPVQAYGWMLRGRLSCGLDDLQGWKEFCQAEKLLEIQDWPSEDRLAFFELSDRLQSQYDEQLDVARRLASGSMKLEAIGCYELLMERLASDLVPRLRIESLDGIYQLRYFALQSSRTWLELEKPSQALAIFDRWPTLLHANNQQPRMTYQDIERLILTARCELLLNEPKLALASSHTAMDQANSVSNAPFLSLQAALVTCQALLQLHQSPQALELLERAKGFIRQCPNSDQPQAQTLWLEQKCRFLCETGQVHQAIEEIDAQIGQIPQGEASWGVLFIKARLCAQLGQMELAEETYLQLLEMGCGSLQAVPASRFLLSRAEQKGSPLVAKLSQFLLRQQRPALDSTTTLLLSQWAIDHQIATKEELYRALQNSLHAIQDPQLQPTALYLNCTLMNEGPQRVLALHQLLRQLDVSHQDVSHRDVSHRDLHLQFLARGLLIQSELPDTLKCMESLQALADEAYRVADLTAGDQILSWSVQRAVKSSDSRVWEVALHQTRAHLDRLESCDSWKWAYIELSFREIDSEERSLPQHLCQLAAQLEQKPTYWGLCCARSHAAALMRVGLTDPACELLMRWSQRAELSEQVQKQAQIETIDLLHRSSRTTLARSRIDALLEQWPQLAEKPWLEIRRYTWLEYEQKAPGSLDNLHSLIVKYRQHPVSLCAYYLKARQGKAQKIPLNEQLRLWEDVERKSQELGRLDEIGADIQALVATASLERAHCLKALDLTPQAIGCLRSLLAQSSAGLCQSTQGCLLEQQARFELVRALIETHKVPLALEQIQLLLRDPYPTQWQAKAQLELALLSLEEGDGEASLGHLRQLMSITAPITAGRLLIAAKAYAKLHQPERAYLYLDELMALDSEDLEVAELQAQGLWELYQWQSSSDPEQARQTLIQLSRYDSSPFSGQAKRLLQSTTYSEKSS